MKKHFYLLSGQLYEYISSYEDCCVQPGKSYFTAIISAVLNASGYSTELGITNFNECAMAGNPIMESMPRQCATPDGRTFIEELENAVGSDKDEHGCIGSAGYSWCEASQKCLRIFEEFCPGAAASIIDSIQQKKLNIFQTRL